MNAGEREKNDSNKEPYAISHTTLYILYDIYTLHVTIICIESILHVLSERMAYLKWLLLRIYQCNNK